MKNDINIKTWMRIFKVKFSFRNDAQDCYIVARDFEEATRLASAYLDDKNDEIDGIWEIDAFRVIIEGSPYE